MAVQGGGKAFQEKVSRLLSRQHKKPVLKPNRPLVLKDHVADRKPERGEASCITEMSVMLACWKQNNFVEALCATEMRAFRVCVEKAQAQPKKRPDWEQNVDGSHRGRRRLSSQQATALLKRYPNIRTEI